MLPDRDAGSQASNCGGGERGSSSDNCRPHTQHPVARCRPQWYLCLMVFSLQVVSPILTDYGVDMPPECPMHPSMDMYSAQVRELAQSGSHGAVGGTGSTASVGHLWVQSTQSRQRDERLPGAALILGLLLHRRGTVQACWESWDLVLHPVGRGLRWGSAYSPPPLHPNPASQRPPPQLNFVPQLSIRVCMHACTLRPGRQSHGALHLRGLRGVRQVLPHRPLLGRPL